MRKFSLKDKAWGAYKFGVIRLDSEGHWEPSWKPLQISEDWSWVQSLLMKIDSWDTWEDAMHGHPLPLIRSLRMPPKVCISRIPQALEPCRQRGICPSYQEEICKFSSKQAPICYDVLEENDGLRYKIQVLRDAWLEDRYILLVPDTFE